jgi:hypothetical protein
MEPDDQLQIMKKDFRLLERNVLLLIAVPLPVFSFAYLYVTSGNLAFDLPEFPPVFNFLILALVIVMLIFQQIAFGNRIKHIRDNVKELHQRVKGYAKATFLRYWHFFWVGLLSAFGLFFYENQGFTMAYAITLLFISLAKPTPGRIISELRLKNQEKDLVAKIQKRED